MWANVFESCVCVLIAVDMKARLGQVPCSNHSYHKYVNVEIFSAINKLFLSLVKHFDKRTCRNAPCARWWFQIFVIFAPRP